MTSIAAGTRPDVDQVLATLSPEQRGMWKAAELNLTEPCTIAWCDHECRWAHDIVGGSVSRLHGLDLPGGNQLSQLEFPPGSPEMDGDSEPHLYVTNDFDDDGLTAATVVQLIAELTMALQLMVPGSTALATWAPPAWATAHNHDTGCMYHEHQVKVGRAQVDFAVTDQLHVTDAGLIEVVRESTVVYINDEDSSELSVKDARALSTSTKDHDLAAALTEALAAYDEATS